MNNLLNQTHYYDNKLYEQYINLITKDKRNILSFDQVLDQIFIDLKYLREKYPQFKYGSNIVLKGFRLLNEDRKRNYDDKNNIKVEDLLPRVWNCVKNYDDNGKFIFYEQIADIILHGSCSQGRTTRLLQFYYIE